MKATNLIIGLICFLLIKGLYAQRPLDFLLPMNLINFQAQSQEVYIQLFWVEEIPNHDNFIIERAGENGIFQPLGATTSKTQTDFLDEHPLEGYNYYRLVGCSNNKRVSCSNVIVVEHKTKIQLMPNPATEYINVTFLSEADKNTSISILNQQGNLLFEEKVNTSFGGAQQLKIDLQGYSAGVYLLRIMNGEIAQTRKFIIL